MTAPSDTRPRFTDEQIEAVMEWPKDAMSNVELFDLTYRVRKLADAAFIAGVASIPQTPKEARDGNS